MSMLRKTVVATVVVGAGLGAMSGSALAWTHHSTSGCSNTLRAANENGAGETLGNTTGGTQTLSPSNTCDIFNGNKIDSKNNTATGDIRNGDLTQVTRTTNSNNTSTSNTTLPTTGTGTGTGAAAGGLGGLLG